MHRKVIHAFFIAIFAGPQFVEIEKFWYHIMFNLASIVPPSSSPSCYAGLTNIPYLLNCLINGILPSTALESGDQRPSHLSFLSFFAEDYYHHRSPN